MQILFQYARNLTLMARRLTPDLYTLVSAAKQIGGDNFALEVLKTARDYNLEHAPLELPRLRMGIGQGELQEEGVLTLKSRLPGFSAGMAFTGTEARSPQAGAAQATNSLEQLFSMFVHARRCAD